MENILIAALCIYQLLIMTLSCFAYKYFVKVNKSLKESIVKLEESREILLQYCLADIHDRAIASENYERAAKVIELIKFFKS